jgi:hypothetical protein
MMLFPAGGHIEAIIQEHRNSKVPFLSSKKDCATTKCLFVQQSWCKKQQFWLKEGQKDVESKF